jgi:hypothetical protein
MASRVVFLRVEVEAPDATYDPMAELSDVATWADSCLNQGNITCHSTVYAQAEHLMMDEAERGLSAQPAALGGRELSRACSTAFAEAPCPNCLEPLTTHPNNGCVLAAMIQVIRERGSLASDDLTEIHRDTDTDALWEDLGPVIDRLEAGGYTA